ncbi:MAG: hypothetical protein NTY01_15340 [Verrucomicrobia bacterium]|nr:hypothetical protein [Verrucomicrobiota bacterium]
MKAFLRKHSKVITFLFIALETTFLATSVAWIATTGWHGRPPLFLDHPGDENRLWLMVMNASSFWSLLLAAPLFYAVRRRMGDFALLTWLAGLIWAFFVP